MAAPTTYDEDSLADYMLAELDDVGRALAISTTPSVTGDHGDLSEAVNDVLFDLGTDDLTTVIHRKDVRNLRAIASVHAWRFASKRAASRYDMKDGTTTMTRSQLQTLVNKSLATAERIAAALGVSVNGAGVQVSIGRIRYSQDPYRPIDESSLRNGLPSDIIP